MDNSVVLNADQDTILMELEQAGFNRGEVGRALDWLDGLNRMQETVRTTATHQSNAIRHYTDEECNVINIEGRGFLLYLEQLGILDPLNREMVIDRLTALDPREVDLGRIKWVVLIALFGQPDKKSALSILQDMVLSEACGVLH